MSRILGIVAIASLAASCRRCTDEGAGAGAGDVDGASSSVAPGGAEPEACVGERIDLASAVVDPRCAIRSDEAQAIRADVEANGTARDALVQEGYVTEDGRVEISLRNRGANALALPLSWHPKIPSFVAFAADEKSREVYELEAPRLDVAGDDAAVGGRRGPHFARIVLRPGGAAFARVVVEPAIVRRLDPPCAEDAGTCSPPRLAQGVWSLHVGQLVTDVEAGPPARLRWSAGPL